MKVLPADPDIITILQFLVVSKLHCALCANLLKLLVMIRQSVFALCLNIVHETQMHNALYSASYIVENYSTTNKCPPLSIICRVNYHVATKKRFGGTHGIPKIWRHLDASFADQVHERPKHKTAAAKDSITRSRSAHSKTAARRNQSANPPHSAPRRSESELVVPSIHRRPRRRRRPPLSPSPSRRPR
jgi:hypothetical protein